MLKVLDLFSGAGGSAVGIHRACEKAGIRHEIVGVDIVNQPRYPFCFRIANAMAYSLEGFDVVWASPVCKRYTAMSIVREGLAELHPDQIPLVRRKLRLSGIPYILENVPRSPLTYAHFLCGFSFGLPLIRHRYLEASFAWLAPSHCSHKGRKHFCIVGHGGPANQRRWKVAQAREAMGIDWMTRDEITQAVPPAYSEFIFKQFLEQRSNG